MRYTVENHFFSRFWREFLTFQTQFREKGQVFEIAALLALTLLVLTASVSGTSKLSRDFRVQSCMHEFQLSLSRFCVAFNVPELTVVFHVGFVWVNKGKHFHTLSLP